jgi:hypothetical protein
MSKFLILISVYIFGVSQAFADRGDKRCDSKFQQKLSVMNELSLGGGSVASMAALSLVDPNEMKKLKRIVEKNPYGKTADFHPNKLLLDVLEEAERINAKIDVDSKKAVDILTEINKKNLPPKDLFKQATEAFKKEGILYEPKIIEGKLVLDNVYGYNEEFREKIKSKTADLARDYKTSSLEYVASFRKIVNAADSIIFNKSHVVIWKTRGDEQDLSEMDERSRKKILEEGTKFRKIWQPSSDIHDFEETARRPLKQLSEKEKAIRARAIKGGVSVAAAGGIVGAIAQPLPDIMQEQKAESLLKKCGVSAKRASELKTAVRSQSVGGVTDNVSCDSIRFDVAEVMQHPAYLDKTEGFQFSQAECDILLKQSAELGAKYSQDYDMDIKSCDEPATLKDGSGNLVGKFIKPAVGQPYFEIPAGPREFGARIPLENFDSGVDLDASRIECFQNSADKKIDRPSCTSDLRTALSATDGSLSPNTNPNLVKTKLYTSAGAIANAGNSPQMRSLQVFSKNSAEFQKGLSTYAMLCGEPVDSSKNSSNSPSEKRNGRK